MNRAIPPTACLATVLCVALLASGCRENPVSFYEAPREDPSARPPGPLAMTASTNSAVAPAAAKLEWTKPDSWTEKPASQMRLASYAFKAPDGSEADISVTSFPDAAGGLLANINRWRGQAGLANITESDLPDAAERFEVAGLPAWKVDFAGTPADAADAAPIRITGAIIPVSGTAWFFKMTGPDATVASQRETFDGFVRSIRAVTPAAPPMARGPGVDPHAGIEGAPPLGGGVAASGGGMGMDMGKDPTAVPPPPRQAGFHFETPPGWQEQSASQFRLASFLVPGPGVPAADVSVSAFPGMTGQDLANVNRWRAQVGLAAISEAELARSETRVAGDGLTFRVFDFESAAAVMDGGRKSRILVAILGQGNTTWFFKMTGESQHVSSQREAFLGLLRSFHFDNGHDHAH